MVKQNMVKRGKPLRLLAIGLLLVVSCVLGVFVSCPLSFPIEMLLNNQMLAKHEEAYRQLRHPTGTAVVATLSKVGLIVDGGNHCDYLVGELRKYSGGKKDVASYYADVELNHNPVGLLFIDNGQFSVPPSKPEMAYELFWIDYELTYWRTDWNSLESNLYFVYVLDMGYPSGWDLRCN